MYGYGPPRTSRTRSVKPPLRIAAITDHLDGHTSQVEAILEAIREVRPIEVTRLSSRRGSPLRSHNFRRLVLGMDRGGLLLPLTVEGDWRRPVDLVVSASGSTTTGNVLMKRRHGAKNIFSGFVRGIAPGDIDCVLAHQPGHAVTPFHVFGPVPVRRFASPRRPGPFRALAGARLAVIVGGHAAGNGYDFDDLYCERLFARLGTIDRAVGDLRWVVVTSRRTPEAAYPAIEAFARVAKACELVDFRTAGPGSLARAHDCDAALVTQDSKTMISEFRSNGYPVAILSVPRPRPKAGDYHDSLHRSGTVHYLEPEELNAARLEAALKDVTLGTPDIYARLRAMIARRIPELFT